MLTYRDLPASAQALQRLIAITHDFAAAHQCSPREVRALLDAVRERVCAALASGSNPSEDGRTEGSKEP